MIVYCALHNLTHVYNRADEMFYGWEESDVHSSDASIACNARVGTGGNEEAFNPQAQ